MRSYRRQLEILVQAEQGNTAIEYALLTGIIALGAIGSLVQFSGYFGKIFQAGAGAVQAFFPQ